MTIRLGAVADDYTGASDLANTWNKAGLRTVQTIGVPDGSIDLAEIDAVVVALKSRSIAADEAVDLSRAAGRWLRQHGAAHVMFKICSTFDSTDRGNIGPVMDALRDDAEQSIALVTPAFPETGRTVYRGHLFVGDRLLQESPLKDHPLNPMHDSNLMRVLARQSTGAVGLVDVATISNGADAVRARLDQLAATGHAAAIADAISERDLEILGQAALPHRMSVGASGLGLGLARAVVVESGVHRSDPQTDPIDGLAVCLAGSCSEATLGQIAVAETQMPAIRLDPRKLLDGDAEIGTAINWAAARLGSGPVLIASSQSAVEVKALQAEFGGERVSQAIERALGIIAVILVEHGVRRLVVAGGETSGAVVDRLGLKSFLLGPEIAPGVPVLRTIGSASPMALALKSGNFGGSDFFDRALKLTR
jgi:uncharacterized protein YgbK (DUF1537 family)